MSCELLASRKGGRLWAALREGGRTVELRVAPDGPEDLPRAERIVKARITSVAGHLGAVFADVGGERAALLDLRHVPRGSGAVPPGVGGEVLAQIRHEGREAKGPRATLRVSILGRRLVMLPGLSRCAVSRRITDEAERARLGRLLALLGSAEAGWIARAAAAGAEADVLLADAQRLQARFREALDRVLRRGAPVIALCEPGLLEELLRDAPAQGFARIVVDDERDRQAALAYLRIHDPALVARVALHAGRSSLFEVTGVDLEIEQALSRRVALPSGGYLVIEETESLVAVDVNTGETLAAAEGPEETFVSTNREAVREIARQLRLRGLGGIVVVDLIDMRRKAGRELVLAAMGEALRSDPARTKIVGLDAIGLLALTREARRPGLAARITERCEPCRGSGRVRRP